MGLSEATCYRWKQLHGGLGPSELRKVRQVEEENQKLKRLVADLSLDSDQITDGSGGSICWEPCFRRFRQKNSSAWAVSGDRVLGAKPVLRQ